MTTTSRCRWSDLFRSQNSVPFARRQSGFCMRLLRVRAAARLHLVAWLCSMAGCQAVPDVSDWADVPDGVGLCSKTFLPLQVVHRGSGIRLGLVRPGEYQRGANAEDKEAWPNELSKHRAAVRYPFYLGLTEVTRGEWIGAMKSVPAGADRDEFRRTLNRPVGLVRLQEIRDYLRRTELRLPTEREWEYACRSGTTAPRYGSADDVAWHSGNSKGRVHDVAKLKPSPWGFYDMLGNAWEWVSHVDNGGYDSNHHIVPRKDMVLGNFGVVRGGGAISSVRSSRATTRMGEYGSQAWEDTGFRVARSVFR